MYQVRQMFSRVPGNGYKKSRIGGIVLSKKTKIPVIAMCYDFDKTLSPDDMQAQGYIQSLNIDVEEFWRETNTFAKENEMDSNLAYMYMMKERAQGKLLFTKKTLSEYGAKVKLYKGVKEWFGRINEYGESKGVKIEHYIISSGLKEMIEGNAISKEFTKIYASSFFYDDRNVAQWPAQVVNYTNKTQYLFRIEKGALDVSDDKGVNQYYKSSELRVPFRNMIYIGDSATDIPCMKLVNVNGGFAIGVYDAKRGKETVKNLLDTNRIRYIAKADYRENSEIDILVKNIIDSIAAYEKLEEKHLNDLAK